MTLAAYPGWYPLKAMRKPVFSGLALLMLVLSPVGHMS
jgi:hypothetical protein